MSLCLTALLAWPCFTSAFSVRKEDYEATDPARKNRLVRATLYMPEESLQPMPAVAFGHGFGLPADGYPLVRELVAQRGMVVLCPHNLGVLPPHWTTDLALDQVFLLAWAVEESRRNASSPFFGRVANRTAVAGHSLGGGSSILAADAVLAAAYPRPTALFTVSLGVYTIPSALDSAPRVPADMPALLFTATEDCVDPPLKNSLPVFDAMKSKCAAVVSVIGGSHCQWAAPSLGCQTTEALCGAHPNVTREVQVQRALQVLLPFLDAAFAHDNSKPWQGFFNAMDSADAVQVLDSRRSCPGLTVEAKAIRDSDAEFPIQCQRLVGGSSTLQVSQLREDWAEFLVVKPQLQGDAVTIVTHRENGPRPFDTSLAIKMKSRAAISRDASKDNVTCADLHKASLAAALASLTAEQRSAYGEGGVPRLRFAEDEEWHTGMWVVASKVVVSEKPGETVVVAPRFYTDASLPLAGGMLYCRLLPPESISAWILGHIERGTTASTELVV